MRIEANIGGKATQIELPDGSTPEQIDEVLGHATQSVGADKGRTTAAVQGFNSAVPFGNRIAAGLAAGALSPFTDLMTSELYDTARANQAATSEAHPGYELAGTLAGIAGTLPIGFGKAVSTTPGLGNAANALNKASAATGNFVRGSEAGGRLANAAGQSLRGAAVAAPTAAVYGYGAAPEGERVDSAISNAGLGAGVAAALPLAGAALGATAAALTPKIDAGLADVATLARKHNIPLSFDQISSSRPLKNLQKISQEVPLSGQSGFRETQMKAFNRALFDTVGIKADRFTPATMEHAFKRVGGEFDNLTKGKNFNIGGNFIDDLSKTGDEVASTYGADAASIYQKEASKVLNDFGAGDTISGELISRQRARINGLARKATDPNIKGALLDLEANIVDGITSGDPLAQAALSKAKQRYKNLIVLEPIATKAKGGYISPSLLNNRVAQVYKRSHTIGQSGEIGDLARIGHELLPELGGSDTTQKLATVGAITAGASNPVSIVPIAAGVGVNRALQSGVNRNQKLIDKQLMKQLKSLPPAQAKQLLKGKP